MERYDSIKVRGKSDNSELSFLLKLIWLPSNSAAQPEMAAWSKSTLPIIGI